MKKVSLAVISAVGVLTSVLTAAPASAVPVVSVAPGDMVRGDFIEWGCSVSAVGKLPNGKNAILTAGHCIGEGYIGKTAYSGFTNIPLGKSIKQSFDEKNEKVPDYAVIELNDNVKVKGKTLVGKAKLGEHVTKKGRVTSVTKGVVKKVTNETVVMDAQIIQGDSGAPMLSKDGRFLGLLSKMDVKSAPRLGDAPLPFWQPGVKSVYSDAAWVLKAAKASTGFTPKTR